MSTSDITSPAGTRAALWRARPTGLTITGIGVVIFNISPFLDWVDRQGGNGEGRVGYETDSLVPFIAYLGIGLLLAMVYAWKRASRGQHRGLSLVSMAVGIAATLQCVAFALNPIGGLERGDQLAAQVGVFVGILGAAVWAVGSGLLARETEGDDRHATGVNATAVTEDAASGR